MIAIIPSVIRDIPARWLRQAKERRQFTPVDPAADALERAAQELEREMAAVEDGSRLLSTAEYARMRGVDPSTVRRWCLRNELAGAVRDTSGDWSIPATARRQRTRKSA